MGYDPHKQYLATHKAKLEQHITDVTIPKSETEWWAQKEIEHLRHRIAELEVALKLFADGVTDYEKFYLDTYNILPDKNLDIAFTIAELRNARNVLGKNQ